MNETTAYLAAAILMFGSCLGVSFLSVDVWIVISAIAVPHLLGGYVFAHWFNRYILGMLLGVCLYMVTEYLWYGPVYKVTGLVYSAAYVLSVAMVLSTRYVHNLVQMNKRNRV